VVNCRNLYIILDPKCSKWTEFVRRTENRWVLSIDEIPTGRSARNTYVCNLSHATNKNERNPEMPKCLSDDFVTSVMYKYQRTFMLILAIQRTSFEAVLADGC